MDKIIKIWSKYNYVYINGLVGTLKLSALTIVGAVVLGVVIALMRTSKFKPFNWISTLYIEILRGTPSLLQIYFFWIGLPKFFPALELTDYQSVLVALIVNSSAFVSEIFRAGIAAVDKGQWEAARSIGLTEAHVMSKIIMPQAIKNILPALGNEFISTVKGTSLASILFIQELTTSYKTVQSATFLALQSVTIAGIIYLVLCTILSKLVGIMERKLHADD